MLAGPSTSTRECRQMEADFLRMIAGCFVPLFVCKQQTLFLSAL
jgi:hypothetical protein